MNAIVGSRGSPPLIVALAGPSPRRTNPLQQLPSVARVQLTKLAQVALYIAVGPGIFLQMSLVAKWLGGVLLTFALTGAASAQSFADSYGQDAGIIDEVRLGIHAHAATTAFLPWSGSYDFGNISDVSFDMLFSSPDLDAFRWLGAPRPEIGATINFNGEESIAHAGLTWQLPVFDTAFYLEGSLGAAIHSGHLDDAPPGERNLGCRVNFYERAGIGMNVTDSVTATLTYEHTSNADLCDYNDGFSNVGFRLGWKF